MWSGTSAGLIRAMLRKARKTHIMGLIGLTNGTHISFDDDDVLAGSLSIDNSCISGSAFSLGSVYAGQLKFSINTTVDRFSLYGAIITLSEIFYKEAASNEYYTIPMGIYTIAEATRSGNWISITAYDNMILTDKQLPPLADNYYENGTPGGWLAKICTACGLTLGNDPQEIDDWSIKDSNTDEIIKIGYCWKTSMDTYRTLLSQVATLLGAYATIGRDGKLYIKRFTTPTTGDGKTWTMATDEDVKKREIADYAVQFTAVQISFSYIDERDYTLTFGADTSSVYSFSSDMLYGVDTIFQVRDIGNAMQSLIADISYVPINITLMGNPAIDVGDGLIFTDKDETVISSYIMHSTWTHHGTHVIDAPGANSAITSQTGAQKTMQLINTVASGAVCRFQSYASTAPASISTGTWSSVLSTTITATAKGTAFLLGSIKFTATTPGTFGVKITVNGTDAAFVPQTDADGTTTISFYEPISLNFGANALTISMAGIANGAATVAAGDCIAGAFSSILQ